MGDTRTKHKLYTRPRKLFDRARIDEENELVKKYGLKNKREIWKAKTFVSKLRRQAKLLIGADIEEQKAFFERLQKMGMKVADISDVLGLGEEHLLERRLQTFVVKLGLARTPREARQFITHRKILVNGNVVDIPSYRVTRDMEGAIRIRSRQKPRNAQGKEELEEVVT